MFNNMMGALTGGNRGQSMMPRLPMGGQQPFSGLPGNQGQGAGPSAGAIQQMLPLLLQQMQQGGGAMGNSMQSQPNMLNNLMQHGGTAQASSMPAPVQAQPPNQNMLMQNSMQSEQPIKQVNPGNFRFGR